jgi:hypothetical protein
MPVIPPELPRAPLPPFSDLQLLIQQALLSVLSYNAPDPKIADIVTSLTAGNSFTQTIDPPDNQTELLLSYIFCLDQNAVDPADTIRISYQDQISGKLVFLLDATFSQFSSNRAKWPANLANPGIGYLADTPLLLKTKATEPYLRCNIALTATATIGTRSFLTRYLYRPRSVLSL